MTVIGIDPGLNGGIAIMHSGELPILHKMPTADGIDEHAVRTIFEDALITARNRAMTMPPIMAFVEKVNAMPKQGVTSMFNFGAGWGLVRGILCGLCIPYRLVTPQQWQRALLAGMNRDNTKAAAYQYVSRLYPTIDYRISLKGRKAHDGKVDALCIAIWGIASQRLGEK
jgi:crossover junction endodeoxyribonuclease RuvC